MVQDLSYTTINSVTPLPYYPSKNWAREIFGACSY